MVVWDRKESSTPGESVGWCQDNQDNPDNPEEKSAEALPWGDRIDIGRLLLDVPPERRQAEVPS